MLQVAVLWGIQTTTGSLGSRTYPNSPSRECHRRYSLLSPLLGMLFKARLLFTKDSKQMANKTMDNYHLKAREERLPHQTKRGQGSSANSLGRVLLIV